MAVVTAFDSGATVFEPADVWRQYIRASSPTTLPLQVGIRVFPVATASPNWNLYGYATITLRIQSQLLIGQSTPISSDAAFQIQLLDIAGLALASGRVSGWIGASWNINRWVGPSRVQIIYLD